MTSSQNTPAMLAALRDAVEADAAIRFETQLVADGSSAPPYIVAPALYPSPQDSKEPGGPRISVVRMRDRTEVRTTLSSVGAEAHRFAASLLEALEAGAPAPIPFPRVRVRGVAEGQPWELDILDLPHRASDAYLRYAAGYAEWSPWRMSHSLRDVRDDVTPMFERAPHNLLCGGWDAFVQAAARIARPMSSTIDGVSIFAPERDVAPSDVLVLAKAQRVDPLLKGHAIEWPEPLVAKAKKGAKVNGETKVVLVSKVGIGDIPAPKATQRVWIDYATQNTVIHLAALRRYRFPVAGKERTPARDLAARTAIAALGLLTYELTARDGYFLRSGCSLVPDVSRPAQRVLIGSDGVPRPLPWDGAGDRVEVARELYVAAVAAAAEERLTFEQHRTFEATGVLNRAVGSSKRGAPAEAEAVC